MQIDPWAQHNLSSSSGFCVSQQQHCKTYAKLTAACIPQVQNQGMCQINCEQRVHGPHCVQNQDMSS